MIRLVATLSLNNVVSISRYIVKSDVSRDISHITQKYGYGVYEHQNEETTIKSKRVCVLDLGIYQTILKRTLPIPK